MKCAFCVACRERAEIAEEEVRQLRAAQPGASGADRVLELADAYSLTHTEARLLALLESRDGVITKDWLYDRLYEDCYADNSPEPKIVDVYVCKLRRKLDASGLSIKTVWGLGYKLLHGAQAHA